MLTRAPRPFRAACVLVIAFTVGALTTVAGDALLPQSWDGFGGILGVIGAVLLGGTMWRWAMSLPADSPSQPG